MPILASVLDIQFNKDDFTRIPYKTHYSYYVPIHKFNVNVFSSDKDILHGDNTILQDTASTYLSKCPCNRTAYHTLYVFMHRCSIIYNNDATNDKVLLLNCDSMISPLIPILAKYYHETIVLDNRSTRSTKYLYESKMITDYLCVLQTPNIFMHKEYVNLQ